jgi:hypothetical protein
LPSLNRLSLAYEGSMGAAGCSNMMRGGRLETLARSHRGPPRASFSLRASISQEGKRVPRKSAASLSVVTQIVDHRPPVPADMPPAQAEIWRGIVNRLPHDWFKREHLEMLQAYCQHAAIAQTLARSIETFDPSWLRLDDGLARLDQLSKVLDREHRAMVMLARSMRLTHQSMYDRQAAATKSRQSIPKGTAPWERFK